MSKKILINASHQEENRVAIVEDGILTELDIELEGREQTRGNIYKATVVRVETGLQAAFVDYGADRMGFLQIGEIHPDLYPKDQGSNSRPRINEILRRGQELLVQITREERGNKGAALTTNLSLAGRYMVLMPGSTTKGISRKVENEAQRKAIKTAMNSIDIPDNAGYIVRTAGIGQSIDELHRDFKYLYGIHQKIIELANSSKAPKLIYQESNLVIRSIRDYFSPDMDEVLIDDPTVFLEAQDFFRSVMPEYLGLLKRHTEHRPIFSRYQIEEQIETISQNKVPLPSGGSIVIDMTEALVAIDVNSGKMSSETGIEATAFKTNIEAATEVGRQLRLRDLGGLIVVDFIDMRDRKHNRDVEKALKDSLKNDKARVSVGRISQFGLLEMSRQRIRAALAEGAFLPCPHCIGSGRVKSTEAQAVAFLRRVHTTCAKGAIEKVEAKVPTTVADYLLNAKREELVELEKSLKLTIDIKGQADYISGQSELELHKRTKKVLDIKSIDPIKATDERPELSDEDRLPKEPEADKPKKKRRRKTAAEKKAELEAVGQQHMRPEDSVAPSAATATDETEDHGAGLTGTEERPPEAEGKPKRRRRRRKTAAEKKAEMDAAAAVESQDQQPPAQSTEAAEPAVAGNNPAAADNDPSVETAVKPKRRRRRKTAADKKAEMEAAAAEQRAAMPADVQPPDAGAPEGSELLNAGGGTVETLPTGAPEPKPKRRRRRKTAAEKKAEMEAAAQTGAAPSAQPAAEAAGTPAEADPPQPVDGVLADPVAAKPKRRAPRKTAAAKKSEEEAGVAATESVAESTLTDRATAGETVAPKRPRRKTATVKPDADRPQDNLDPEP